MDVPRLAAVFVTIVTDRTAVSTIDTTTGFTQAIMLPMGKSSADAYSLRAFSAFLKFLPYGKMILQVDQEPPLLSLARRSAALSGKEIAARLTPKGSKGSLGAAERAQSTIMGKRRSLLVAARSHSGNARAMEDLLGPWSHTPRRLAAIPFLVP